MIKVIFYFDFVKYLLLFSEVSSFTKLEPPKKIVYFILYL